jgi:hypothetical protein
MPQLGVAYEQHHAFRVDELLKTLTSFSGRKKMGTPRQTVSRQTSPSKQSS